MRYYTKDDVISLINHREGERKFGEKVQVISEVDTALDDLKKSSATYVLLGIKESVGVKANKGVQGTESAWDFALKALLNTQNSPFNKGKKLMVLGCLEFDDQMKKASKLNINNPNELSKLYHLVSEIDTVVTNLIFKIVSAGKIPIIIGGGHNNAYGNIKGTSLALNKAINAINFDAHTDFRSLEGRHSGNGFSYAFKEGFLDRYYIYGIHENYTSKAILERLEKHQKKVQYTTFEALEVRTEITLENAQKKAIDFISKKEFGLEIDIDAIQNISSSAMTPSGFSTNQARQFVSYFGKSKKAAYLHLCEAAPILNSNSAAQTGKLLSYLITDFISANLK